MFSWVRVFQCRRVSGFLIYIIIVHVVVCAIHLDCLQGPVKFVGASVQLGEGISV